MLSKEDEEYLEYDVLIQFCELYEITNHDAHYYLKLAYERIKNKVDRKEADFVLKMIWLAAQEEMEGEYIERNKI